MRMQRTKNFNHGRFELGATFSILFIFPQNRQNRHFSDVDRDKPDTRFLLLNNRLSEFKHTTTKDCGKKPYNDSISNTKASSRSCDDVITKIKLSCIDKLPYFLRQRLKEHGPRTRKRLRVRF